MLNDRVKSYTDQQLREELTALGMDVGPITSTTRTLYERKLVQLLTGNQPQLTDETDNYAAPNTPPKSPRRTPVAVAGVPFESDVIRESPNGHWNDSVDYVTSSPLGESTINLIRPRKPLKRMEEPVSRTSYAHQTSPFPAANAQFRKTESAGSIMDHVIKFALFGIVMFVVVYFIANQDPGKAIEHRN